MSAIVTDFVPVIGIEDVPAPSDYVDIIRMGRYRDVKLRFTFKLNSTYMNQSVFKVEVFNADSLQWNELWTLGSNSYTKEPDGDYGKTYLMSGYTSQSHRQAKADSWNSVFITLMEHVELILGD